MSEVKFTKGEWIAYYQHELLNEGHVSVESDNGELIYVRNVYKSTLIEQTANANLIAAAPEMYQIIYDLRHAISFGGIGGGINNAEVLKSIDGILAKARGEK